MGNVLFPQVLKPFPECSATFSGRFGFRLDCKIGRRRSNLIMTFPELLES